MIINKTAMDQTHLNYMFNKIGYISNILELEENMEKNDHISFVIGFYLGGVCIYSIKIYVQEIVELIQETEAIQEKGYIKLNSCEIWRKIAYQRKHQWTCGGIVVDIDDNQKTETSLKLDKRTCFNFDSSIFDKILNDMKRVIALHQRLHS